MSARLIGLTGTARSGKDTVADILVDAYGFKKRAFAQPLYNMLQAGFGIHVEHRQELPISGCDKLPYDLHVADGDKNKVISELGVSLRTLTTTLGTEWGRDIIGEDTWVNLAQGWYSSHKFCDVVFTDVRFVNEAEFIINNGGRVFRVNRPLHNFTGVYHKSEEGIPYQYLDAVITNNSTHAGLVSKVRSLIDWPDR